MTKEELEEQNQRLSDTIRVQDSGIATLRKEVMDLKRSLKHAEIIISTFCEVQILLRERT